MTDKQLIKEAQKAMQNSYSPYSNFKVGAALLTKSGKVFYGTNVECASFGATNCAERSAIFSAISNGEKDFVKLAIVSSGKEICYPCGICRQVIYELLPNAKIICAKSEKEYQVLTVQELLPCAFNINNNQKN